MTFTSKEILALLSIKYAPDEWAFFSELKEAAGFSKKDERRFDAFAINLSGHKNVTTVCFEIKASLSDYNRELQIPIKRRAGLRYSNLFYFVTPKNLVKIENIPVECGLIEVTDNGDLVTKIEAPWRNIMPPTFGFMASIIRNYDKDRAKEYKELLKKAYENKIIQVAAVRILEQHILKWKNFTLGNKEIPDIIRKELQGIYDEIILTTKEEY